jgi:hypothetical protein
VSCQDLEGEAGKGDQQRSGGNHVIILEYERTVLESWNFGRKRGERKIFSD